MSQASKKKRFVFFDLGNTLLHYHRGNLSDHEKDYLGILKMHKRLKGWEIDVSISSLIEAFYKPWCSILRYRRIKKVEYSVAEYIQAALPITISNRQMKKLILDFYEPTLRFSEASAEVVPFLAKLKERGFGLAVISNSPLPGYCHDKALKKHGILPYLSFTLYSYDLGFRKPSYQLFELAFKKAKCSPDQAFMVGDSEQLDIIPAEEFGMSTILYSENKIQTNTRFTEMASKYGDVVDLILKQ